MSLPCDLAAPLSPLSLKKVAVIFPDLLPAKNESDSPMVEGGREDLAIGDPVENKDRSLARDGYGVRIIWEDGDAAL